MTRLGDASAATVQDVLVFRLSLHLHAFDGVAEQTVERLRYLAEQVVDDINGRQYLLPGREQFVLAVEFTGREEAAWQVEVPSVGDAASASDAPMVWPESLLHQPNDERGRPTVRAELLARLLRMLGAPEVDPNKLVGASGLEVPQRYLLPIWAGSFSIAAVEQETLGYPDRRPPPRRRLARTRPIWRPDGRTPRGPSRSCVAPTS